MRALYIFFASALLLGACSGDDQSQPDAGNDADTSDVDTSDGGSEASTTYPAFVIDAPQVTDYGGLELTAPKVQPVFFPGFDYATQLTDFNAKIGASSYWAALAEYKIGPITSATPITLTSADAPGPAISDAQIQAWLKARWDGTHPEFGTAPDVNTIYALYYPTATVITLGGGGGGDGGADAGGFGGSKSCMGFGGYHGDVVIGTSDIAYAVLPECATFGAYTGVDVVTTTTSHELSEAVTDPFTANTGPAYITVDDNHLAWSSFLGGGEIGDMCAQFPSSFYKPTDFAYLVQRNWSNKQAKAGHDPCVPADSSVYFNAMPVLPDKLTTIQNVTTEGVNIPVGTPKTIDIDLFSDGPTLGNIIVSAQAYTRTGQAPVTITLDKTSGLNGQVLHATLTSTAAFTSKSKTATLVLTASNGARQNLWIALLGQQ
jgi:hypothetical protein